VVSCMYQPKLQVTLISPFSIFGIEFRVAHVLNELEQCLERSEGPWAFIVPCSNCMESAGRDHSRYRKYNPPSRSLHLSETWQNSWLGCRRKHPLRVRGLVMAGVALSELNRRFLSQITPLFSM
jgi:hypothetical protein